MGKKTDHVISMEEFLKDDFEQTEIPEALISEITETLKIVSNATLSTIEDKVEISERISFLLTTNFINLVKLKIDSFEKIENFYQFIKLCLLSLNKSIEFLIDEGSKIHKFDKLKINLKLKEELEKLGNNTKEK